MASYATVPATDLESEATLLNSKDEMETAVDGVTGNVDDDVWTTDTCEEFQQWPKFAEKCGSWTLGQCDAEYKEWVAVWKIFRVDGVAPDI